MLNSSTGLSDNLPGAIIISLAIAITFAITVFFLVKRKPSKPDLRHVSGSRIALAVGDKFATSNRFTGFVHEESGASIVLMELPEVAYEQLQNLGRATDTFAAQGVVDVTQQQLKDRSDDYVYLRGSQKTALVEYAKYILIFKSGGMTGMVTANIPKAALTSGLMTGHEIETILTSAQTMANAPKAAKLFTLGYLGPFEEDVSLLGTTKGYRLSPAQATNNTDEPKTIFLVAPSLTQAPIANLNLFAERSFLGIEQIHDKTIDNTQNLDVAGLPAVEVLGHGFDLTTTQPAIVYQLVVEARHGGYFRLIGLAPDTVKDRYISEFRKIGESFRPTA